MAEDLQELHSTASALLEMLEADQRARMLRVLARDIRKTNQRRMAAQKAPDGTAWEKRRPRATQRPATRPIRFLYPSAGAGEPRLVDMRSWIGRGDMVIGFDREADGMRTFRRDKVIRWITAEGSAEPNAMSNTPRGGRGRVRRQAQNMFRGLRTNRWLKAGATPESAWIEFAGRAARIAIPHHYGLRDRVTASGAEVDYPERPLIGFAPTDESMILNRFIDVIGDAMGWGRRAGR